MRFTARQWLEAAVGAVLFVAIAYPLLVLFIVAGQP